MCCTLHSVMHSPQWRIALIRPVRVRLLQYGYGLQIAIFCNGEAVLIASKTPTEVAVAFLSLQQLEEMHIQACAGFRAGLGWVGLGWAGSGRVGLGCVREAKAPPGCAGLDVIRLGWFRRVRVAGFGLVSPSFRDRRVRSRRPFRSPHPV